MTVSKAFINLKTVSVSETFIKGFQFKFLDDIIYTNVRMAKTGYVPFQRTPVHFVILIQKRSFIYFMNVRSQISSSQMSTKSSPNETCSLGN